VSKSTEVFVKDIDKRETLAYMPSIQNSVVGGQKNLYFCANQKTNLKEIASITSTSLLPFPPPCAHLWTQNKFSTTKVSKSLGLD
jgi:hypothetical protein